MKKILYLLILILSNFLFFNNLKAETPVSYSSADQTFYWGMTNCTGNCVYNPSYSDKGFSQINSQYYYFDYALVSTGNGPSYYYGAKMIGLRINNTSLQSETWYKVKINLATTGGPWITFNYSTIGRVFNVALQVSNTWSYTLVPNRSISGSDNTIVALIKPSVSSTGLYFEIGLSVFSKMITSFFARTVVCVSSSHSTLPPIASTMARTGSIVLPFSTIGVVLRPGSISFSTPFTVIIGLPI